MLIDKIVAHFGANGTPKGSQKKTSEFFGFDPTWLSHCRRKSNHAPVELALLAEKLSDGELVFDKEYYQDQLLAKHKAKG